MSIDAKKGLKDASADPMQPLPIEQTSSPQLFDIKGLWRIETLTSLEAINRNAWRWLELERNCVDPNAAFQSFVWCESWARQYCKPSLGDDAAQPFIFLIYRGETLVALLPMMVAKQRGARVLTLLGEPHSQIANALTRAGVDCTDGLKLCLAQAGLLTKADLIALGPVPQNSPLAKALDREQTSSDPAQFSSDISWPALFNAEDFVSGLSKNRRRDFQRNSRRLNELGCVSFERIFAGEAQFPELVQKALDMKRHWLRDKGLMSVGLSSKGIDDFLIGMDDQDGSFEIDVEHLTVDGDTVAVTINLVGNGIRQCYLSAYSQKYSDVSPGMLAHLNSIQNSISDGLTKYSFLGYPTHFKRQWLTEKQPLIRFQQAITLRGRVWLSLWVRGLRPFAKVVLLQCRKLVQVPVVGKVMRRVLNLIS